MTAEERPPPSNFMANRFPMLATAFQNEFRTLHGVPVAAGGSVLRKTPEPIGERKCARRVSGAFKNMMFNINLREFLNDRPKVKVHHFT